MKTTVHTWGIILFQVFTFPLAHAQTPIAGGDVSGIWTQEGSPYRIMGDITIPDGLTLTIEPGVKVEFQGSFALNVQGALSAVGTETDTILFTVNDTTGFFNRKSKEGGWSGIMMNDTPVQNDSTRLTYCRLEYSKAYGDVWYDCTGGALFLMNVRKVSVSHSLFENCCAGGPDIGSGGAISLERSSARISHTHFRNNRADYGAAIHLWNSEMGFTDCIFEHNTSSWIGGVFNCGYSRLTFNACILKFNKASLFGGALGVYDSELSMTATTLTDNVASVLGGALHSDRTAITIDDCLFERDSAGETGGGMFLWKCDLQVDDSEFKDNTGQYNYGAIGADSSDVRIMNSSFSGNHAVWGGTFGFNQGVLNMDNCAVLGSTGEHGGALISSQNVLTLTDVRFDGNSGFWGGAMDLYNCNLEMDGCRFTENSAADLAGAIQFIADTTLFTKPVEIRISETLFEGNSAVNHYGAVYISQRNADTLLASVHFDRCIFTDNLSDRNAAMFIQASTPDIRVAGCTFRGNTSVANTAALGIAAGGTGEVYNCLLADNSPQSLLVMNTSRVNITNCTLTGSSGSALSLRRGGIATLTNSILWGNGRPAQLVMAADLGPELNINHCDVEFGLDSISVSDSLSVIRWGVGNFTADPLFADTASGNYRLADGSPCLEAGITTIEVEGQWILAPSSDLDGNPRPSPAGTNPDIGAYESSTPAGNNLMEQPYNLILNQNRPNPFHHTTLISWNQPRNEHVRLEICDLTGKTLFVPVDQERPQGRNQVMIDGFRLREGIYLYRLQCGTRRLYGRMVVIR